MAEAPGTEIGHYRIVGPVGRGGFATVYRAKDLRFDTDVALKVLAENHSLDPDIRERFLAEARLLRRIDSFHVVRLTDIGETNRRQPFMVLDFAEGGSLRDRLDPIQGAGVPLDTNTLLMIARSVADALAAVHSHDVVHRDVSPGNLLLTSASGTAVASAGDGPAFAAGERLVLADLGFAKDLAAHSGFTMGGGTSTFGAPEQQRVGRVDQRADIFAASAVVAWAATGDASGGTAYHHVSYGEALTAVYRKGMASDPEDRYPTAIEWKRAIQAALGQGHPHHAVAAQPVAAPGPSGRGRGAKLAAFVAAAGLTIGLAGGWAIADLASDDKQLSVEQLDDGRLRVSAEDGTVAAALFIPAEIIADRPVTIQAGANGATAFLWILPSGELVTEEDTVTFTPNEGPGAIALIVTGTGGDAVELRYDFDASPS